MSEDRFRFPDFFTLRVKIKVIRSREWIRYVVEILRFDDQAFVAKVSDALNLKRTFELIKEQTAICGGQRPLMRISAAARRGLTATLVRRFR